jgi:hypothetical protein
MADTIAICEAGFGTPQTELFRYKLKSARTSVTSEAMKQKLAAVSSPQPVENHSDEDKSCFVSMVIAPLEGDDHDTSLLPILEEDGILGEWTTEESGDMRWPNYSVRQPGPSTDSEGSFTSLKAALSLEGCFKTLGLTDTMEIRSTDLSSYELSDGNRALTVIYAAAECTNAPLVISKDECT